MAKVNKCDVCGRTEVEIIKFKVKAKPPLWIFAHRIDICSTCLSIIRARAKNKCGCQEY